MTKYRIELTEAQLKSLAIACEVCARIKIGQPGMAVGMLRLRDSDDNVLWDYAFERQIDEAIKPKMGLGMNSSWGVGKYPDADVWFDLYTAFRHRLAWDDALDKGIVKPGGHRQWPEMMGVDYDEPMHWGDQPLAVVAKIEEDK